MKVSIMSRGSGNIHPIAELENEDGSESQAGKSERDRLSDAETKLKEVERMLKDSDDPFKDPEPNPLGSHPVSPETGDTLRRVPTGASRASPITRKPVPTSRDEENWTVERGPDEGLYEDDERTSSNLSDRSQQSARSAASVTRTSSRARLRWTVIKNKVLRSHIELKLELLTDSERLHVPDR